MFDRFNEFKDKIAVITENDESFTYGQLSEQITQVSDCIKTKSLIFVVSDNFYGGLVGYLASIISGNTAMLLDKNISQDTLEKLNSLYKPEYLWCPKDSKAQLEGTVVLKFSGYVLINCNLHSSIEINRDLALLLSTSGSTGSSKMVRISYKNLNSNTESIIKYLGLTENDKTIVSLPMNYSFGLSVINTYLSVGASIIFAKTKMFSKRYWELFDEYKVTSIYGVPFTYDMLVKLGVFKRELSSLRFMAQAGAALPAKLQKELVKEAERRNIKFFIMYGQTEATARISYLSSEYASVKLQSIGKAIPGGKLSVVDSERHHVLLPGEIGELMYEGDNVTMGYAGSRDDLQKGDERDGRLYTGDLGYCDNEGFYYITGRKKRYVKIYGNRVSLDEIERLVVNKFECECAAVCVNEDEILICINQCFEEAADYISDVTGISKKVFMVHKVNSIPKTASGKIAYAKIEEEYRNG